VKLKNYLTHNKIKLTDFARKINYSKGNVSNIVNGKIQPSFRIALLIQKVTNNEVMPLDLEIRPSTNHPPLVPNTNGEVV
jgi:transcriptional regulator with XRE-family HTH domain